MRTDHRRQGETCRDRWRKIGVFGGSFNPVHNGHLQIAKAAMECMELSEVWFIPAGDPYMKQSREMLPARERLRLTRLAVQNIRGFSVDPIETQREGASYTVDTLEELAGRHPDCRFYLIVGEDAFSQMPLWKSPERILKLSELIVAGRKSGADVPVYDTAPLPVPDEKLHRIALDIDISSTMIRRRILHGESITGMVPENAEEEIRKSFERFFEKQAEEMKQ